MIKTGEILRKAREEKGLSLNEVALTLKISTKILNGIENGDATQLPAKTFLRGFVQSYATHLRLNVDEVMKVFYEEMGSTKPKPLLNETPETDTAAQAQTPNNSTEQSSSEAQPQTVEKQQDHLAPINEKNNTKAIVITAIGILLLGLILFTKKMIDKYSKEAEVDPSVVVAEPLQNAEPAKLEEAAPMSSPTTAVIENLTTSATEKKEQSKAVETPATTTAPTTTTASTPAVPATQTQVPAKPAVPVATTTPPASTIPAPAPAVTATAPTAAAPPEKVESKPIELIIEALDNVEVTYSSNSGKTSSMKLTAEQIHTFKSKNGLKLTISNGGAVNLILNGRDLGIPGDLGKTISLSY